jgi:Na+/proline symporter
LGALLGVFTLGILTRRAPEMAAIGGMLAGLGAVLYVRFFTGIAWTWYVVIGSLTTFVAGWLLGLLMTPSGRSTLSDSGQGG